MYQHFEEFLKVCRESYINGYNEGHADALYKHEEMTRHLAKPGEKLIDVRADNYIADLRKLATGNGEQL